MNTTACHAGAALAMLVVLAPWVAAQTGDGDRLDPKAVETVKAMCGTYAGLSAGGIGVQQTIRIAGSDATSSSVRNVRVLFSRPNRIRIEIDDDEGTIVIVADGKTRYDYVEALRQYVETEQETDIASVAGSALVRTLNAMTGRGLIVLELFTSDSYSSLMEGVTGAHSEGVEKIDDVPCHHVKLVQGDAVWELWATEGEAPRLLKTSADLSRVANAPADVKILVTCLLEERESGSELEKDAFAFVPPEGAEKVDAFGRAEPQQLIGKTAPDFEMDLLDGGKMKLSDAKGKRTVILDFWATWCGPCRMAMPILDAVAKDYADKGVELYGVNQQEKEETIRAFLEETGLSVTVGLDPAATIADRYLVSSIPQTVIVGKDGTVQAVHVGVSPAFDNDLREQLDTLLAGKVLSGQ